MLRLLPLLLLPAVAIAADKKPNVILIVADDLGQRDLGCYGSTYHKTPNLDAFAKQGVKLTDAYAACHVCSPTRAALLTGKHPARLHITDWIPGQPNRPDAKMLRVPMRNELPLEEVTIAEALKKEGYATASIGKWHLGGAGFEPTKQGFDVNFAGDSFGQPPSYFAPYKNKQRGLPGVENAPEGEYLTDRLTVEAEKFLESTKGKPFFLYMPHFGVHTPLQAKKELQEKYKPGVLGSQGSPVYAAMLESVDESFGRILKKLDDMKVAENTIVIFTSDNGGLATVVNINGPTSNAPYREGKGTSYEGGFRIPFLIRGPGIQSGNLPIISTDVTPTLLGLCGIKTDLTFDGRNLSAALGGAKILITPEFYWHYPHHHIGRPAGAMRIGNWKYIEFYDSDRKELYDLSKDVSENRNQAADQPELVKEFSARLHKWLKDVNAELMTPNPDWKPNPQAKNGTVTMPGRTADVHGTMLRFEPAPHKNTLGFWTKKEDYATFEFTLDKPGKFTVEVLQGCGKGSGGAEVEISVGESKFDFTVKDTGGFQMFEAREVGTLEIAKAGRHTLTVKPKTKPGAAVMDLRQVVLKPTK